jgi:hypothetical protein
MSIPNWAIDLLVAVQDYEQQHSKEHLCLLKALEQAPIEAVRAANAVREYKLGRCGARTVFWPDDEACDAECWLPAGHEGEHEDEILGEAPDLHWWEG